MIERVSQPTGQNVAAERTHNLTAAFSSSSSSSSSSLTSPSPLGASLASLSSLSSSSSCTLAFALPLSSEDAFLGAVVERGAKKEETGGLQTSPALVFDDEGDAEGEALAAVEEDARGGETALSFAAAASFSAAV